MLNSKKNRIADLADKVAGLRDRLDGALSRERAKDKRIRVEYERHVPVITSDTEELWLGNSASGLKLQCAAKDCAHFWPCPTWHMLRRIDGNDRSEYRLKLRREREQ